MTSPIIHHWLLKSEPSTFSIEDLRQRAEQTEIWDGVRNHVAKKHLQSMHEGDLAFFYHSSCKTPGIVGIVTITETAFPDLTAQQLTSPYYDPRATPHRPIWYAVRIKLVEQFPTIIPLTVLKTLDLGECPLTQKGNRLSVIPLSAEQWHTMRFA